MSRADYAHWNEEADARWWAEEGQYEGRSEYDDYDPDDYLPVDEDGEYEDIDDVFPEPAPRVNAFGQALRPGAPELPGDRYADEGGEDRHLEMAYEDRFEVDY
jgi:hypothetical protein